MPLYGEKRNANYYEIRTVIYDMSGNNSLQGKEIRQENH
jgi:hypothetical protein